MICRHVTSIRDIETVLYDPEIQSKAPGRFNDYKIPDATYVGCYLNYKIISLFIEHKGKGHFYCLKPHRKHARECFRESLRISPPVYFEVPTKSLENFAMKFGFVKSGQRLVKHG